MIGKALTWDEIADIYDEEYSGCSARTLPTDKLFTWAEKQVDRFYVDPDKGTIHKKVVKASDVRSKKSE